MYQEITQRYMSGQFHPKRRPGLERSGHVTGSLKLLAQCPSLGRNVYTRSVVAAHETADLIYFLISREIATCIQKFKHWSSRLSEVCHGRWCLWSSARPKRGYPDNVNTTPRFLQLSIINFIAWTKQNCEYWPCTSKSFPNSDRQYSTSRPPQYISALMHEGFRDLRLQVPDESGNCGVNLTFRRSA